MTSRSDSLDGQGGMGSSSQHKRVNSALSGDRDDGTGTTSSASVSTGGNHRYVY